ncbi:MAG: arylsulfatase [Planctomycetaceae bacterium]|nr:arylsulfatase [Planctomycetaceae bacterium]
MTSLLGRCLAVIAALLLPVTMSTAASGGAASGGAASRIAALRGAARLPNVVIILVDDMGYGDAGCYNSDSKIPTPHIDSLARDGMLFTDAHASGPLCHLSRYGLMTGRYPFRTQLGGWAKRPSIAADRVTLPGLMQAGGYRTAMVGKWHLGFAENGYDNPLPGGPVDRGFASYFGIRASTDIPPYFYIRGDRAVQPPTVEIPARTTEGWSPIQGEFWRKGLIAADLKLHDVLPRFTAEACDVIADHAASDRQSPLMMYLAYPAPHTPWLPSEQFRGKSGASMYGDFAMMVDHNVGQVLTALQEAKMADNTLVIFSSDNGPVWYDEDTARFQHDSSGGLRGMKSDAWEGGHRMPFLVRWPGFVKAGSRSDQTISFVDVMATMGDLLGSGLPEGAGPDSYSFFNVLTGQQPESVPVRKDLVLKSGGGHMAIRSGDWKYIDRLGSGGFSKPRRESPDPGQPDGQLYNLADDPGETNNLVASEPKIARRLKARMQGIARASGQRMMP